MANEQKTNQNKSNHLLLVIAAVAVVACVAVVLLTQGGGSGDSGQPTGGESLENPVSQTAATSAPAGTEESTGTTTGQAADSNVQVIGPGESLVIPVSEVTTTATFYPIEVDGTLMEVLAVRDSQGTIRTAFNTCQVCYSSGRGYYEQKGNALICQNCGSRFSVDQVEIQTGGCNPWPIFPEDKTQTEETISISYDVLREVTWIFAYWKKG